MIRQNYMMRSSISGTAFPSVSFVMCSFNSQETIGESLMSIENQEFPRELIEVIVVDGGSTDKTLEIVQKFSFCRIVSEKTGRPEAATAIGYNQAKNELIVNFPSDNVILDKNWLIKMVKPFQESRDLVAAETIRYSHLQADTLLNRYFALFGMNDPLAFYLGKRDKATYFENNWRVGNVVKEKTGYFITKFNHNNLPTVGANGFIVRRNLIQLVSRQPLKFFHIDACLDLVDMGHDKIAFVETEIWHKTGERFFNFFKRKLRYANVYFKDKKLRRYHLFDPKKDKVRLVFFIVFSLTLIEPIFQSTKGFVKKKDFAWFLHPVICFAMVFTYFYAAVINMVNNE
jgi:glycosyltransferase involved in cell wall biosynthesis